MIERNRADFQPLWVYLLQNYNFWKYQFWVTQPLNVTWPRKRKLAIISETVRVRAKRSKLYNPVGFITYKITTFENIDFGSHDPSRSNDLGNVNWPLSQKPLEIERNGAIFLCRYYYLRNYNFWKYRFWVTWPLKVTWPQKRKLAIISETVRDRAKLSKLFNPVG